MVPYIMEAMSSCCWYEVLEFLLVAAGIAYLTYWTVYLFFLPMNRILKLEDGGYYHLDWGQRRKTWINRQRRLRKEIGETRHPYPNGWFPLMETRMLKNGESKYIQALGQSFAVFRGEESGKAFVTSTYCPHLGADLTAGGRVFGDCISCPFHDWTFQGKTGKCEKIPGVDKEKIPKSAFIDAFTSVERNGFIWLWHHAEGEPPSWFPQVIPEMNGMNSEYVYQGRAECEVAVHVEELSENGADATHFNVTHKPFTLTGHEISSWKQRLFNAIGWHEWNTDWRAGDKDNGEGHLGHIGLEHTLGLNLFGLASKSFNFKVHATHTGPGFTNIRWSQDLGFLVQAYLPIEPQLTKVVHLCFAKRYITPVLGKFMLYVTTLQFERDLNIWNNKINPDKPVLVKSDSSISKHRNWYTQFYSIKKQEDNKNEKNGINGNGHVEW